MLGIKQDTLTLPSGKMDYCRFGRGKRPLVLLPGLSLRRVRGAGFSLAWMYRRFAWAWQVYVFDRPEEAPQDCTLDWLAQAQAQAMEQLGLKKADVWGVSQGGMIAQYLAIDHPELVGRLVLAVTASRQNPVLDRSVRDWIALGERGDWAGLFEDMMERMYSQAALRRYRPLFPLLGRLSRPKDEIRFLRLAGACLTCDCYQRLDQISCPVLVLGGTDDRVLTGEASREIAHRTGGQLHLYGGLGHAAYDEAKDFNRRVYAFLREQTER